MIILEE